MPVETLVQVAKAADKDSKVKIEAVGFSYVTGGIEANTAVATDVPLTDFPILPILSWHNESVNADPFFKAVQEGLSHTSEDETRYVLQGMNYSEKGEVAATDGRRLYLREGLPAIKNSCIVPTETCKLVEDGMSITFNKVDKDERRYIRFTKSAGGLTIRLTSHLVDGIFPNFRQVIPAKDGTKWTARVNSVEFSKALRRASVTDPKSHSLRLDLEEGHIALKGKRGSFNITAHNEGVKDKKGNLPPHLTICLDQNFLLDALDIGLNRLSFIESESPCVFTSPAKPQVLVVLMPKRVTADDVDPVSKQGEEKVEETEEVDEAAIAE